MSIEDIRSQKGLCLLEALEAFEKISDLEKKLEDSVKQLQIFSATIPRFVKDEIVEFPSSYRPLCEDIYSAIEELAVAKRQFQNASAKARQLGIKDIALLKKI